MAGYIKYKDSDTIQHVQCYRKSATVIAVEALESATIS